MHHGRHQDFVDSPGRTRSGILYLGALREILVISAAAGIVLAALSNAKTVFQLDTLSQENRPAECNSNPVLGLQLDRDNNSLVVHSWPGEFEEIQLDTGTTSWRQSPQCLVSAATSETNSTSILLSQWVDNYQVTHEVFIIRSGEVIAAERFELGTAASADVRISADGTVALAVSHEGLVIGWDLSQSEPVRWEFHLCGGAPTNSLSPDGSRLLVATFEGHVMICDSRTGQQRIALTNSVQSNRNAAWSSDGQRVAIGFQNGDVTIFDSASGGILWNVRIDFLYSRCLTLSQHGNRIAIGGFDKQIRIWDFSKPTEPPIVLTGESSIVHNMLFARDDSVLFSGSSDGTIREWSLVDRCLIRQIR